MIKRLISFPEDYSFFLFGARGTGKSHLLRKRFADIPHLYVDLLRPKDFDTYSLRPDTLSEQLDMLNAEWVIIDEVQKLPRLLDLVHYHIERTRHKFVLCGSSARKLRHGGANLLAGRAFTRHLFPLTSVELGQDFNLNDVLSWGALPGILQFTTAAKRIEFLTAYTHTYLHEEILQEQVIRKLDPFRKFLHVSAQMSGQVINYSKIAREIGSTAPTVQTYFQILEDTLVGQILPAWDGSVRKRQSASPKFYYFDTGVLRALTHLLEIPLKQGTYAYGIAFEHFLVNEIYRLVSYQNRTFQLSYLRTRHSVEVDIILEQPGMTTALIEIKSTGNITEEDVAHLQSLGPDIPNSTCYCFSLDPKARRIGRTICLHWQDGLREIGLIQ
jgi:uncharacterized protein